VKEREDHEVAASLLVEARAHVASQNGAWPGSTHASPLEVLVAVWKSFPRHEPVDRLGFALARRALAEVEEDGGGDSAVFDAALAALMRRD
jgi:hypothetical protein